MQRAATFSACGKYRYLLTRRWSDEATVTFVMLNPSTADADRDDPTIRKCIGFAQRLGFGSLQVINLFAFRAVSPFDMLNASQPVGPRNRVVVECALAESNTIICAWGVHGSHRNQDRVVLKWLNKWPEVKPLCLGMTNEGQPKHPLYLPYTAQLTPYFRSNSFAKSNKITSMSL